MRIVVWSDTAHVEIEDVFTICLAFFDTYVSIEILADKFTYVHAQIVSTFIFPIRIWFFKHGIA